MMRGDIQFYTSIPQRNDNSVYADFSIKSIKARIIPTWLVITTLICSIYGLALISLLVICNLGFFLNFLQSGNPSLIFLSISILLTIASEYFSFTLSIISVSLVI